MNPDDYEAYPRGDFPPPPTRVFSNAENVDNDENLYRIVGYNSFSDNDNFQDFDEIIQSSDDSRTKIEKNENANLSTSLGSFTKYIFS